MKKAIKLLCGIMCLFMVMTVLLTGCDFGNIDVAHGKDQTPVYYGMLLFDSSDVKIPEVNYVDETSNSSDNHYGWYKDDNGLVRSIHDKHKPLYVSQNQDVYAYVGISNPSEFQIVSFVINGQMFTSDMFDARSTNEIKIVKLNVGNARGIVEYTVSDIKYADGKEIKNVYMLGDPVAKASVKAENQITATVNKIELKDSGKEIFFDITITDEYGLIASGNGNVKLLVYRDGKVQKEAELTVGENKITIKTLNKNKEHEYEIVAYYDDFSGNGSANHTLVSKYPLQKDHSHTFGDWETTKAPTCGKDGEKARICSGCGTSEAEKLSATGLHSFDNNCDATCNGCEFIRTVGDHVYNNACDWDCNVCGYLRAVGDHVYDDQYDDTCNECGFVRDADCKHVYDNDCDTICNACGEIRTVDPSVHVYDNACDWNCNICGYPRAVGDHVYDNTCDTTCNVCGATRMIEHIYDNACDTTCNVCGATRTAGGHSYASTVTPPTATENGAITYTCSNCGNTYSETIIPQNFTVTADNRAMVGYTGAENENLVIPAVFEDNGTWYRVTSIGDYAFYECTALVNIDLPESVVEIGSGVFSSCSSLVHVNIPEGETWLDSVFSGCSSLEEIVLPDSVQELDICTFMNCTSLKKVIISPNSSLQLISQDVFYGCVNLTSIFIPKTVTAIMFNPFNSCPSLETVYYAGSEVDWNNIYFFLDETDYLFSATRYYYLKTEPTTEGNYWHWVDGVPTVWEVEIHSHNYEHTITTSNNYATILVTYNCSCGDTYSETIVPQDFTVTAQNRAMVGYTGAENENLVIPAVFEDNGTWYRVTAIGDWVFGDLAFANRSNLISVTIPDSVTTIGYGAFSDCNGISSVTIPKSVVSIGRGAFADCDTLTNIVVDGYNTTYQSINGNVYSEDGTVLVAYAVGKPETSFAIPDSVIIIGEGAFSGCYNLTNVTIPNSVTTIGIEAFYRCFSLISIIIPDSVTDINTWAFYGCGLQSVTIGAGVKNVGTASFFACSSLKTIVFEDGATVIGSWMFGDCSSLTDVVIPSSISLIYGDAFDRCSVLKSIYYKGTVEEWNAIVVDNTYTGSNNIRDLTIYYYSETQPTTEGNFWHYVDGVPMVWDAYVAPEELEYTLSDDGTYYIVSGIGTYSGSELVIPSEYKGLPVKEIGYKAFESVSALTSIVIPESIVSIGDSALACCSFVDITIPNSVINIGSYALAHCTSLESVKMPNTLTNLGNCAFRYCLALNSIEIPDGVTLIAYDTFYFCESLISIVIPDSVTMIQISAFPGCSALSSVYYKGTMEEWNAIVIDNPDQVPDSIYDATRYYYSATEPTTEGNFWHYVDGVPTVWEVSSGANYSEGLEYALNEDGKSYSVTGIGTCADTDIVIPNTYEGLPVTGIGNSAFTNCYNITSVTIPDSVTSIGNYLFRNCFKLTSIIVDETNTAYQSIDGNFYSKDGTVLIAYACAKTDTTFAIPNTVTTIGGDAFWGCTNLMSITIGDTVTTINDWAFAHCCNLTSLTIPNSVTTIGEYAFCDCEKLTSVTIPSSVTSIGNEAFFQCYGLMNITVDETNAVYQSINGNLYSKDGTVLIVYTSGKTGTTFVILNSVTTIGDYAFDNCSKLTSITIPSSVTTIGMRAFQNCDNLTNVTIPNSVTTIEDWAFAYCDKLANVTIPDSITGIGSHVFYNCSNLTSVTIPDSVGTIGMLAFYQCTKLTSITFEGTVEKWEKIALGSIWNYNVPATYVQCSDGIVSLN